MSKKKFRVGQTVQSIYDATPFVIDKSVVPERIFHEKGSNRWWAKNELQRLGAPENPATSLRLNGKAKCAAMRHKCAAGITGGLRVADEPLPGLEERKCLECGLLFQPRRHWQKFHSEACRRANWWRAIKQARGLRGLVQSPRGNGMNGAGFQRTVAERQAAQ